jgi:hypothetical protein
MTRLLPALLSVVCLGACDGPAGPRIEMRVVDPHGGDAGEQTSGCLDDATCGAGQICVNCDGVGKCTPGCRDGSQCGPRDVCQLGTVCESCPCPPGWCVLDPCRDDDRDGFVPGNDPTVSCPGKQKGDCNDGQAAVNPAAPEDCSNYRDDNCDGVLDERDSSCTCPGGEARCTNSWDCPGGPSVQGCWKGCCSACSDTAKPSCSWASGYCAQPYGVNAVTGCSYGWTCDNCSSCPSTVEPVCATNGSTYDNACLLGLRHLTRLHDGACLPGEGLSCLGQGFDGGCGPSGTLYCRSMCAGSTSCGSAVCTQKGACVVDADCPAGLPLPSCDAGSLELRCVSGTCSSVCR